MVTDVIFRGGCALAEHSFLVSWVPGIDFKTGRTVVLPAITGSLVVCISRIMPAFLHAAFANHVFVAAWASQVVFFVRSAFFLVVA